MPNTRSAKKALTGSNKKRQYNLFWKSKIKDMTKVIRDKLSSKSVVAADLSKDLSVVQKLVDKASNKKVIHKNKANRLKSRYAHKIALRETKQDAKAAKKPRASKSAE
ncbi:30S ribosomal protein S20 [Patescibacteria group bacterium]|nr:30S ribosomal protein S20 [Patescibacteria group bacterium]